VDPEEGRGGREPHACSQEVVEQDDGFKEVGGNGEDVEFARRFDEGEGFEQDSMDTNTWEVEQDAIGDMLYIT